MVVQLYAEITPICRSATVKLQCKHEACYNLKYIIYQHTVLNTIFSLLHIGYVNNQYCQTTRQREETGNTLL